MDSSVLTVCTLGGSLRPHLLASEATPEDSTLCDEAEQAVTRLRRAIEP